MAICIPVCGVRVCPRPWRYAFPYAACACALSWAGLPSAPACPRVSAFTRSYVGSRARLTARASLPQRVLNVRTMSPAHVGDLLASLLPALRGGATELPWPSPAAGGGLDARAPPLEWMRGLWQYLLSVESLGALARARHPLLPVMGPAGGALAVLDAARSRVLRDTDMPPGVRAALHGLGLRTLSAEVGPALRHGDLRS